MSEGDAHKSPAPKVSWIVFYPEGERCVTVQRVGSRGTWIFIPMSACGAVLEMSVGKYSITIPSPGLLRCLYGIRYANTVWHRLPAPEITETGKQFPEFLGTKALDERWSYIIQIQRYSYKYGSVSARRDEALVGKPLVSLLNEVEFLKYSEWNIRHNMQIGGGKKWIESIRSRTRTQMTRDERRMLLHGLWWNHFHQAREYVCMYLCI
jgi:hypothetical protein